MTQYRASLRDRRCVFDEVLDAYATLQSRPGQREFGDDLGSTILEDAVRLTEKVLGPLSGPGNKPGCRYALPCGARLCGPGQPGLEVGAQPRRNRRAGCEEAFAA